jgi:glutathione S-transferase
MTMKFYYAPHSCALASHIALEEVGAAYEAVRVDFRANEQRGAAYMAVNPKGRVPSLVTEKGVLTETPAILMFVAQSYPEAKLAPLDDLWALAQVQSFNAYLCATVHVAHAHRMRGYRWADDPAAIEAMKKKVPQAVGECFELIERSMFKGPFAMGERYTICDPYLFTLAQWWELDGVDPARLPRLADFRRRMAERPVVQRTIAAETGESRG